MNINQFSKEFKHIASTPEGVKCLREMILSLAFQGSLAKQINENASSLLASLEDYRANAPKAIYSYQKQAIIERVKPPFTIPEHWQWLSLGDIGHDWGQKIPNTDFTYIDVSSINSKKGLISEPLTILKFGQQVPSRARKIVRRGSVIYSTIRPYLLNIALINCEFEPEPIASTAFVVIQPWEGILPKYVYYYLRCPYFLTYVQSIQSGVAYPAISDKKFFSGRIPIPPTLEQEHIVTRIDELMALCDKLESQQQERVKLGKITRNSVLNSLTSADSMSNLRTSWSRLEDNLSFLFNESEDVEQLKIAILELAIFGKLNARESRVTIDNTLKRMQARKHDLANRKLIKRETSVIDFPGVHELRVRIPETWIWCRLNDIASIIRGGSPRPAGDPQFYGGNIPFLKVADITRARGMFVESFTSTIKEEGLKKTREITQRTVLLTNSGATLGVPSICDFRTTFNDGIAAFIELAEEVFDEYLYFYLKARSKWLLDIASRGQGQPNLNTDIIRSMWFPLPPMAEQRAIVEKAKHMLSLCEQLVTSQELARTVAESFAIAAIASITGIQAEDKEKMKTPKTELVSTLRIGVSPTNREQAPLAAILIRSNGEMPAKTLWQTSGFEIDVFYQQLKTEMVKGWIVQPELAHMREVEVS
jgi:type I restriction enzyme, S subunit